MIAGSSITLRPLDRLHLQRTREWANDYELARLLDRAWPISDQEHEQWFLGLAGRKDCLYFAVETNVEHEHVGNIWLWDLDWRHRKAELRILLGENSAQGRGLGTQAIALLTSYAFERLNLHKIYAYTLGTNPRARRAFLKARYYEEAILKRDRWVGDHYADVHRLAIFRDHCLALDR